MLVDVLGVALTDDPVEEHILLYLDGLKSKNERFKKYIKSSGAWAIVRNISLWKPYDFLNYFCNLYQRKYRREYKLSGNIVRTCQRIEEFMLGNKISGDEFKEFIDLAFTRFFTEHKPPVIGSICSAKLFNSIMIRNVKNIKRDTWFEVEQSLERDNEEFERLLDREQPTDYLDIITKSEE